MSKAKKIKNAYRCAICQKTINEQITDHINKNTIAEMNMRDLKDEGIEKD